MIDVKNCKSRQLDGTCNRARLLGVKDVKCSNYVCIMKQSYGNETDKQKRK
jgi:hypothetical protein